MIYVPYDFQYNCGKNTSKKSDSCSSSVLYVGALISRRSLSLSQMKEMCHLSRKNSPGFHYFVCPSVPAFVSPTASEVVFSRGRGLHCISLPAFFLIFLPSSFSFIQNLEPDLCLPSHTKKFE